MRGALPSGRSSCHSHGSSHSAEPSLMLKYRSPRSDGASHVSRVAGGRGSRRPCNARVCHPQCDYRLPGFVAKNSPSSRCPAEHPGPEVPVPVHMIWRRQVLVAGRRTSGGVRNAGKMVLWQRLSGLNVFYYLPQ